MWFLSHLIFLPIFIKYYDKYYDKNQMATCLVNTYKLTSVTFVTLKIKDINFYAILLVIVLLIKHKKT